jgi:hypothetical protein
MAELKSYLLSFAAFLLLAIASVCSFFLVVSIFLDEELASLTTQLQQTISPMIQQNLQQQQLVQSEDTFLKLKTICSDQSYPETLTGMCHMIQSGSINDSATFSNYVSKQYVSTAVSSAVFKNLPLIEDLRNWGRLGAFFLFVTFFLALFLIYLDLVDLKKTISRVSLFCAVLAIALMLLCFLLVALVPATANSVASSQKVQQMDIEKVGQYAVLLKLLSDWFSGYLLKISLVYLGAAILSVSSWQLFKRA